MILLIFIWHLDHDIVLDYFKDYDFWIMDIFIFVFLLLLHCVEWRLFPLISWSGMGLCWRTVFTNFRVRNPVGLQSFSLRRISARWNWVEKLVFCVLFIYLLVCYLFIYCLFVCLLFNYFKGAVCYLMHQLCRGGWGGELFLCFGGLALA